MDAASLVAIIAAIASLIVGVISAKTSASKGEFERLLAENQRLFERMSKMEIENQELRSRLNGLIEENTSLKIQVKNLQEENSDLRERLDALEKKKTAK